MCIPVRFVESQQRERWKNRIDVRFIRWTFKKFPGAIGIDDSFLENCCNEHRIVSFDLTVKRILVVSLISEGSTSSIVARCVYET